MTEKKTFRITYEVDVELTANEIWPDGDGPENPTSDDVIELVKRLYGYFPSRIVGDWALDDSGQLCIDGKPVNS